MCPPLPLWRPTLVRSTVGSIRLRQSIGRHCTTSSTGCDSPRTVYQTNQTSPRGAILTESNKQSMFTTNELSAIADLITFHDDWDEVSEHVGVDVEQLYDKVIAELSYNAQG